jgi:phosphoribosylformimino-5-aminoimidazole carboxamide ribotide isomerase
MFRIVFVIDLLKGNVVHAMRGERAAYQPVRNSMVCNSSNPVEMVSSITPKEVYIADLDRLQHTGNNMNVIKKISMITRTMVNIGVEKIDDIENCLKIAHTVIVSTEASTLDIIEYASRKYPGRINVTVDIKNGKVLTRDENLKKEPEEVIKLLNEYDINDIVVIDLTKVGTGAGINEDFLYDVAKLSHHDILFGGGIRDMDDINTLKEIGVGGVLVATAVHNGKIPLELVK